MKKLDWDRYVPLGMDGKKVRNKITFGLGVAIGFSLSFLIRFRYAVGDLYVHRGSNRYLMEGARIVPFRELLPGTFWAFAAVAFALAFTALGFYNYHKQGSRSIYTMKRLPSRWELWRRVLILPVCGIAACGLLVVLLTGIYYLIYLLATPAGCLP